MTEKEQKLAAAFRRAADARLPKDFADRLVRRINATKGKNLARMALLAASLTMLFGFVPVMMPDCTTENGASAVCHDSLRPGGGSRRPADALDGWAFLGFCHEALRRRVRTLLERYRRREEE